jgi:hypothetical protein
VATPAAWTHLGLAAPAAPTAPTAADAAEPPGAPPALFD